MEAEVRLASLNLQRSLQHFNKYETHMYICIYIYIHMPGRRPGIDPRIWVSGLGFRFLCLAPFSKTAGSDLVSFKHG